MTTIEAVTDLVIALMYVLIAARLVFSSAPPNINSIALFIKAIATVILLSGLGHGQDSYYWWSGFYEHVYPLRVVWNSANALISVITAYIVLSKFRGYMELLKQALTVSELTVLLRDAQKKIEGMPGAGR